MKTSDYKERLIALINILIKYSDSNTYISTANILEKLENEYSIITNDRKTIVYDIKALKKLGFNISSSTKLGYSLLETPFNLYEIKILEDLLLNFKNINQKDEDKLINKLHHFISDNNLELLNKIRIPKSNKKGQTFYFLDIILNGIKNEESLIIKIKDKESEIIPYLLHLNNNYYYLYYSYLNSNKIYHVRIDNIVNLNYSLNKHHQKMLFEECYKIISESINSYSTKDLKEIKIALLNNKDYILDDISNTFDNAIINKNLVFLKVRISNQLFAKLASYGDDIKILKPTSVAEDYKKFLNKILTIYN